jgi:hypothetical protein
MGLETLTALRDLHRRALREAVAWCRFESLALVLSRLLPYPVTPASVLDRAVGLGLLRLPVDGTPPRLTPERVSRLLLAGYRLPALAVAGTPATVREHLAARRHVFLVVDDGEPAVVQLHALLPDHSPAWALVAEGARLGHAITEVAAEWLFAAREGAGRLMVAAAQHWDDLAAAERRFFGGTRERDGSYHWDAADCDTDAAGRILRLW